LRIEKYQPKVDPTLSKKITENKSSKSSMVSEISTSIESAKIFKKKKEQSLKQNEFFENFCDKVCPFMGKERQKCVQNRFRRFYPDDLCTF